MMAHISRRFLRIENRDPENVNDTQYSSSFFIFYLHCLQPKQLKNITYTIQYNDNTPDNNLEI